MADPRFLWILGKCIHKIIGAHPIETKQQRGEKDKEGGRWCYSGAIGVSKERVEILLVQENFISAEHLFGGWF
jgi:hypothetical protein